MINFEVWIPSAEHWNHEFLGVGNGGYNGVIQYASLADALKRGFAAASTDTGHTGADLTFAAGHPEKIVDWGYRAIHVMTEAAKLIIREYSGALPKHAFFMGCSTGGHQALSEVQRFPADYDGMATLRSVYMDLATALGEQGFRWIFLVHSHGAPNHHKALTQASDYFHDVYGGTMVDLFGLEPVFRCCGSKEKVLTAKQLAEDGFSIHAGAEEQSEILFLKPELVPESYKSAPSLTGANFAELAGIAKGEGWPGYFGAPRFATAAMGAMEFIRSSENLNATALQILNGLDPRKISRWADKEAAEVKYDEAIEKREMDWLKKSKIEQ